MIKFSVAAALLSLAVISPASAKSEALKFQHDGVSYTYTVKELGENKRMISGHATPGASFRFVVYGDTVSGTVGGSPVRFGLDEVKPYTTAKAGAVTVASR